jgi:hypothetical protein
MSLKKILIHYVIKFVPCLAAGILMTFAYSLKYHEEPGVDWLVAFGLAVVMDLVITWLNIRQEKHQEKATGHA